MWVNDIMCAMSDVKKVLLLTGVQYYLGLSRHTPHALRLAVALIPTVISTVSVCMCIS